MRAPEAEGVESQRATSPSATLFATTGGGDADIAFSSHANFKYILANQQAKASACAAIASVGGSFPLLRVAVLSKMGCGFLTAHVEDFPAVVLAEAAAELQSQLGAYHILKDSARAAASGAGRGGERGVVRCRGRLRHLGR